MQYVIVKNHPNSAQVSTLWAFLTKFPNKTPQRHDFRTRFPSIHCYSPSIAMVATVCTGGEGVSSNHWTIATVHPLRHVHPLLQTRLSHTTHTYPRNRRARAAAGERSPL